MFQYNINFLNFYDTTQKETFRTNIMNVQIRIYVIDYTRLTHGLNLYVTCQTLLMHMAV